MQVIIEVQSLGEHRHLFEHVLLSFTEMSCNLTYDTGTASVSVFQTCFACLGYV